MHVIPVQTCVVRNAWGGRDAHNVSRRIAVHAWMKAVGAGIATTYFVRNVYNFAMVVTRCIAINACCPGIALIAAKLTRQRMFE
jgi:hypothetical protein